MIIIGIISFILYAIAMAIIWTNLYAIEKKKKIRFMIIGMIISAIFTCILVAITSPMIEGVTNNDKMIAKQTAILLFSPIHAMLILPYIGHVWNGYQAKKWKAEQTKKRLIIFVILLVIFFLFEIKYIQNFQLGLLESVIR